MSAPILSCKAQVQAMEPTAHAVNNGFRGITIEADGRKLGSGYTVYQAWASALRHLCGKAAA